MQIKLNDNMAYIRFNEGAIAESESIGDLLVGDFDSDNKLVGIEVLDVQGCVESLNDFDKQQLIKILRAEAKSLQG